jgi:toxin-antitoxin system PIN domain toxin
VALTAPAVFGFLRLSTNRRIFDEPLGIEEAVDYVEAWQARPNVRFLVPGRRHLELAFGLLRRLGAASNLTTDVQLAAYALENGATLYSNDTDFGRFPGLDWINPLKT